MRLTAVLIIVLSLAALGVLEFMRANSASMGGKMSTEQLEEYLMELDREFDQATAERGIDGWVSYFAADGKMFPAGMDVVEGHDAIRAVMGPSFESGTFSLRWTPVYAEVASSGDLGYTHGTYVASNINADGVPVESYGKYVSIWRKQPDGNWKIAVDLGTPSPPPGE